MAKNTYIKVTVDVLERTRQYLNNPKYESLTDRELATLIGISYTTLGRIKHGDYDHLLEPKQPELTHNVVHATIEYAELQHLFACEQLVKDLLEVTKISDLYENELYFPGHITNNLFKKHLPHLVEARLEKLSTELTDSCVS